MKIGGTRQYINRIKKKFLLDNKIYLEAIEEII